MSLSWVCACVSSPLNTPRAPQLQESRTSPAPCTPKFSLMATVPWESPEPCPCHLPEQDPSGHLSRTDPNPDPTPPGTEYRGSRSNRQQNRAALGLSLTNNVEFPSY